MPGHEDIGQSRTADLRAKQATKRNALDSKYITHTGSITGENMA